MNITETISLLDELRGKASEPSWYVSSDGLRVRQLTFGNTVCDMPWKENGAVLQDCKNDAEYIVALHNNYETLRKAALDGERYRKAGEVLEARLGEHAHTSGLFPEKDCFICNALITYRQAVEQKEV